MSIYVAKMPLKSYKICSKIFEHGNDPPPFERCSKKLRIWERVAPLKGKLVKLKFIETDSLADAK